MLYFAFLRAINVGNRRVKMDDLRRFFEDMGFADVSTFIASGNVVFEAPQGGIQDLENKIERRLEKDLGYEVVTFVRTRAELQKCVTEAAASFGKPDNGQTLYVGFLHSAPTAAKREAFLDLSTDTEDLGLEGRELFWFIRGGLMDSAYSGAALEKLLGQPTTLRSLNTLERLLNKYG